MEKYFPLLEKFPENDKLRERYEELYEDIARKRDFSRIQISILTMCELLHRIYGKTVMLFIDEYDTPFIEKASALPAQA